MRRARRQYVRQERRRRARHRAILTAAILTVALTVGVLLLGGCELFRYHFIGHTCAPSSLWLPLFRWLVVWLDARRADELLEGETA